MKFTHDPPIDAVRDLRRDGSNSASDTSEADYLFELIRAAGIACAAPFGLDPSNVPFSAAVRINRKEFHHEIA